MLCPNRIQHLQVVVDWTREETEFISIVHVQTARPASEKTDRRHLERFPAQIFHFCSYSYKQFELNHKTRNHFRPFSVQSGFHPRSCFKHVLYIFTAWQRHDKYLSCYTLAKPQVHTPEDNEWKFQQTTRNERTTWINRAVAEDSWIFKTFLSPSLSRLHSFTSGVGKTFVFFFFSFHFLYTIFLQFLIRQRNWVLSCYRIKLHCRLYSSDSLWVYLDSAAISHQILQHSSSS